MDSPLKEKKILLTAGPTQEHIDPVRYISNHSSGKMGMALANAFAVKGAKVTLVLGPVAHRSLQTGIKVVDVVSAREMYDAAASYFPDADIAVMAAAVADYTPVKPSDSKIKREADDRNIQLKPTRDIAAALGSMKKSSQILVGFALETHDELENAAKKLQKKNLDMILLNSLQDKNAGFGYDTNKITILDKNNNISHFGLKTKEEVAGDILNYIVEHFLS